MSQKCCVQLVCLLMIQAQKRWSIPGSCCILCPSLQEVDAAGGWRFRHEAWLKPMPKGPRTVDLMGSKALAAAAWSLAATVHTCNLSCSSGNQSLVTDYCLAPPSEVARTAATCVADAEARTCCCVLQEQTHTEAFRELWREVGRRGTEGMGAEQKTLMQVHQVSAQVGA